MDMITAITEGLKANSDADREARQKFFDLTAEKEGKTVAQLRAEADQAEMGMTDYCLKLKRERFERSKPKTLTVIKFLWSPIEPLVVDPNGKDLGKLLQEYRKNRKVFDTEVFATFLKAHGVTVYNTREMHINVLE